MYCCDMWMIERGDGVGFLLEACDTIRFADEIAREKLQCYNPLQPPVARLVDNAHAAFAELVEDLVMGDDFADHFRRPAPELCRRRPLTASGFGAEPDSAFAAARRAAPGSSAAPARNPCMKCSGRRPRCNEARILFR